MNDAPVAPLVTTRHDEDVAVIEFDDGKANALSHDAIEAILSAFAQGRFPGSRNDNGFRGSRLLQGGLGAITPLGELGPWEQTFGVVGLLYQDQGRATWDGEIDVNTGYQALSATIGISWKDEEFRNRTLSLILPIPIDTPDSTEGTYEPGPILSLGIGF
mgnify:CR=1 FL=1